MWLRILGIRIILKYELFGHRRQVLKCLVPVKYRCSSFQKLAESDESEAKVGAAIVAIFFGSDGLAV